MGNAMKAGLALGLVSLATLTACGGSDDGRVEDDFGASELFADYADVVGGGYRSIGTSITDAAHTSNPYCGYTEPLTLREASDFIRDAGGSFPFISGTKWCGETDDETLCLVRAGGSFVTDDFVAGNPSARYFEIVIPGLTSGAHAYFSIDSSGGVGDGSADIERRDNAIPSSGSCTPSSSTQVAAALDGSWTGWRVTYSRGSRTGAESTVSMACVNNNCTVSNETFGVIPFTSFKTNGSWKGSWSNNVAAVSMISAGNAIAMYVCGTPLDESRLVDDCVFYGLSKL